MPSATAASCQANPTAKRCATRESIYFRITFIDVYTNSEYSYLTVNNISEQEYIYRTTAIHYMTLDYCYVLRLRLLLRLPLLLLLLHILLLLLLLHVLFLRILYTSYTTHCYYYCYIYYYYYYYYYYCYYGLHDRWKLEGPAL